MNANQKTLHPMKFLAFSDYIIHQNICLIYFLLRSNWYSKNIVVSRCTQRRKPYMGLVSQQGHHFNPALLFIFAFIGYTYQQLCFELHAVTVDIKWLLCSKDIERHIAHTIVSWPDPKQWVIAHTSDFMMIVRQSIYIFSKSSQRKWVNWKHTAPHIVHWITERIWLILLTHSTNYIWQAFYKFNVFR